MQASQIPLAPVEITGAEQQRSRPEQAGARQQKSRPPEWPGSTRTSWVSICWIAWFAGMRQH